MFLLPSVFLVFNLRSFFVIILYNQERKGGEMWGRDGNRSGRDGNQSDDNDGAAVCKLHSNLQQIVWHTNIMGGKNSAHLSSNAADENDGAAVCNHFSSLRQIVGIPTGEA